MRRGAGRRVGSGRRSGGCLLDRCGSVLSCLVVGLICSIVSVSGVVSDIWRAVSGHSRLLASCQFSSHPVRFGPFLVPLVSSVGRCGGGRVACFPVLVVAGGAGVSSISSRSRFLLIRYEEWGGGMSGLVLLAWSRCRCRCEASCCSGCRAVACPHAGRCG